IIEILSGWMRGFGYSFIPALICIIGICGVRITWVYTAFASDKTFPRLMTAYPISWTVTALGLIISYLYVRYYKLKGFFGRKNKTEA
ncbi:MAG: MATE family efflux transporter, partial [Ruminococcus sp.]|nr:MATE family efflux transporter [Ruminococcus sp.]